ncbi:MAG: hypothetical protein RL662_2508 [Bacteroidota bacterium]|jgi:hypothetical protein
MKKTNTYTKFLVTIAISLPLIACIDKTKQLIDESVAELNTECPIQLDMHTRLNSSEALPQHTMKFNYTILMEMPYNMDTSTFKAGKKPQLVYNLQTNKSLQATKEKLVTFIYSYTDEAGKELGSVIISPADYNAPIVRPEPFDISSIAGGNMQDALQILVDGLKKHLPIDIPEQGSSIVDCKILANNELEYTYKMDNEMLATYDSISFKKNRYKDAMQNLRSTAAIKKLIDQGLSVRYTYKDREDKKLCSITISGKDLE